MSEPIRVKGKYSQNDEDAVILDYFKDRVGTLIDIGANDGKTFSNSFALIEKGWAGDLFEPVENPFRKLHELHKDNPTIFCHRYAIGAETGLATIYESGSHVTNEDWGLISTLKKSETERWKGTPLDNFTETQVQVLSWSDFYFASEQKKYEFVSIDAEGLELEILTQMDLEAMEAEMICIETNFNDEFANKLKEYLTGYKLLHRTFENCLFAK